MSAIFAYSLIRRHTYSIFIRQFVAGGEDHVVASVISATAGIVEEAPHESRLATTLECVVHQDIQKCENKSKQLMKASVESQTLESVRKRDGKVRMLMQGLPPLAFGIAGDEKLGCKF